MMSSLLAAASAAFPMLEQGFYVHLNWLGQFVRIIVEGVGIVGVGVIVFTLILKAITTPFDVYQRIKMRKQTLIMRQMQPELEKLQKQYANDKQTYSMKMLELQKKNGYSMFGACLPMIISFVILIIAVTAFQSYAQYANLSTYEKMATAYNNAVLVYAVDGKDYHLAREGEEDDGLVITVDRFSDRNEEGESCFTEEGISYTLYRDGDVERVRVQSEEEGLCLYYTYELASNRTVRSYYIDLGKAGRLDASLSDADAAVAHFKAIGSAAAAENFRKQSNPGFLWVKNVWYPDVSYAHPIQEYGAFTSSINSKISSDRWTGEKKIADVISEDAYNSLTADLETEKGQPNGYFILIVLTIGLMVLSQFIMMRSQKETNQYQTVDGQGARTQKIMMVAMPMIYAITGFLWTAAFSIYIAVSSIIGIVITLISNVIIGQIFKKKEEEALKQRYTRNVPWKESRDNGKKNKK